jgi:hypothetical protein
MRLVEHTFRAKRPIWLWLLAALWLAFDALLGYFVGWALILPAVVFALIVVLARPRQLRLERDERGAAHLVIRGRGGMDLDLSRLAWVDAREGAFRLVRDDGKSVLVTLDARLRAEVSDAARRRRLELSPDTEAALLAGVPQKPPFRRVFALSAATGLLPLLLIGVSVLLGGGIERDRNNEVDPAELRATNTIEGALVNPFAGRPPAELYLVPADSKSRQQLPELATTLRERFGMQPAVAPPALLDADVLNRSRKQLDGWKIADRLIAAYDRTYPERPVVIIAVTRLDTFNPARPDDRFAFLTSGWSDRKFLCGGTISTARFDVWPGSEEERLAKMASRLLARCLSIDEGVSIRSVRDVDRLDDRAGPDAMTIARRVAERRALGGAR